MRKLVVTICLLVASVIVMPGMADMPESAQVGLLNGGFEDGATNWAIPGEAAVVGEGAHGGAASLRFLTTSADWGPCALQRVAVPMNTSMTVSGCIKAERLGAAEIRLILYDADGKYIQNCEVNGGMAKGTHDWAYFRETFNTGTAQYIDFWLRSKGCGSVAYFDDLTLTPGRPHTGNYLRNSGFSICPTPGYPSWWSVPVECPVNTKDWEAGRYYGLDNDVPSPVPGVKVLRVRSEHDMEVVPFMQPPLPKGVYTASAYLKADGDVSVFLMIPYCASQEFKPAREWQRFQFTFTETCQPGIWFKIKGKGVVWIAAPQLEDVNGGIKLPKSGGLKTDVLPLDILRINS